MVKLAKVGRDIEYKAIGSEIKVTSQGIVEGYLNRTGIIDSGDDKSVPGCFKKTLSDSYARKAQQSLDYLWPFLYNHSYAELPVGGIFYGEEDKKGLFIKVQMNMDIQSGREVYASFKNGTLSKFSMGYRAVQVEWEKSEGHSIRLLKEVAVMEGSCVVFPMNDESIATAVKNRRYFFMDGYESKGSASGKTSWPLADRGVSWDGGQAKKDIQAWATSGDSVNWSKAAQCFFWVEKSPPENLSQCKMPFVMKSGGTMKAIPQGIISAAGAVLSQPPVQSQEPGAAQTLMMWTA